jgi:ABC-type multidrug transport system ATPase subunit
LLRILAGLLRPTEGTTLLKLGGAAIRPPERRRWVGYAAPELDFYPELSVAENLCFTAEARGLRAVPKAVMNALDGVGLVSRARDRVAALSSGMLQRLRLAFALLHRPAVLLLDEPGSHLDDEGRTLIARMVDAQQRAGVVVIATNDEREWKLAEQRIELTQRGLGNPA